MVSTVGSTVDASVPGGDAIMSDASTDAPCDNGINPAMAKLASYVAKVLRRIIMIDLKKPKPILSCIGIDGFIQKLLHEGLQQICYSCGRYGHTKEFLEVLEENERRITMEEPIHVIEDFRMVASTSNDQGKYGSQKVVTIVQPSVVEGQEVTVASHVSMVKEAIIVLWLLLRRATMDDHCQMSM
ncbi:hypothetical protein V6N12_009246 [Hibiscus sabdariffa]|uniref:Zinc knuckle CX2CX4HX4C domain-containing protein n=1 Tax=Hibiscus sabdariffa TaxID=183260 RepID=A0ABR2BJ10_9ROSI